MNRTGWAWALLAAAALAPPAGAAELVNHGAHGEFFRDAATGLIWFDPDLLVGASRDDVDAFVQANVCGWTWASSVHVDALVGRTSPAGQSLEDVMGPRQFTVGAGGPRWIGWYSGLSPDGWLVESDAAPDFATLTASGFQNGVAAWNPGGWVLTAADPVTQPRLVDRGDAGQYFRDEGSSLYWCDPAQFMGQTREQVADWLSAHPRWRWATFDDLATLVGRMSAGDAHLQEVLGPAWIPDGGGDPYWEGWYAESTEPAAAWVGANIRPWYHIVTSLGAESSAEAGTIGAWVVSEWDPTATATASWGQVKRDYR